MQKTKNIMDDYENDEFRSKAFDISEDISYYDCRDTPTNGYEYLHRVMSEARKCPDVVVAKLDRTSLKKKQTFFVEKDEPHLNTPTDFIASQDWQEHQTCEFSKLRTRIETAKLKLEESRKNSQILAEDKWLSIMYTSEPSMNFMLELTQKTVSSLLEYIDNWFNEDKIKFCRSTSIWLFSIFACLEIPLLPVTVSLLRSIAVKAIKTRAKLSNDDKEQLTRLNLIICIVGRVFKQFDLADSI